MWLEIFNITKWYTYCCKTKSNMIQYFVYLFLLDFVSTECVSFWCVYHFLKLSLLLAKDVLALLLALDLALLWLCCSPPLPLLLPPSPFNVLEPPPALITLRTWQHTHTHTRSVVRVHSRLQCVQFYLQQRSLRLRSV